jgi:hypothetical protein
MYGTGTRSYNRSSEAREMKRQQKLATEKYQEAKEKGEIKPKTLPLLCRCLSFRYPHEMEAHQRLRGDHNWPTFEQREKQEQNWEEWAKPL